MIITENLLKELQTLNVKIETILQSSSLTDLQIESFIRNLEKRRYNILNEIKQHNERLEFEYEKIKTIDNEYKAEFIDDTLRIYIPEVMPSYKNLKTHTYKRILLNVTEITKSFENLFNTQVCIYIKIFNNIEGWDIDNKQIKPIADALISSKVIQDDNISKMFYIAEGEFSEIPHTEICVFNGTKIRKFLEKYNTQK